MRSEKTHQWREKVVQHTHKWCYCSKDQSTFNGDEIQKLIKIKTLLGLKKKELELCSAHCAPRKTDEMNPKYTGNINIFSYQYQRQNTIIIEARGRKTGYLQSKDVRGHQHCLQNCEGKTLWPWDYLPSKGVVTERHILEYARPHKAYHPWNFYGQKVIQRCT